MERIIYISGKVTGLPYPEACAKFDLAAMELREAGFTGQIINPLKLGIDRNEDWGAAMNVCMRALKKCSTIYMLDNWKDSRDAKKEMEYACLNSLEIFYQSNQRQLKQAFDVGNHLYTSFCFKSNMPDIQASLILAYYGHENQMLKAVEEMSELTREIARMHSVSLASENAETVVLTHDYISELADVRIMVEQLWISASQLGFKGELESKIREKLSRTINHIQIASHEDK